MSRHPLHQLREVLSTLEEFVMLGREQYDNDRLIRWSIQRLWIFAGNLADAHCDVAEVPAGVEPWSDLIAERNVLAHYLPDEISDERVWSDTAGDTADLREQVEREVRAIGLAG